MMSVGIERVIFDLVLAGVALVFACMAYSLSLRALPPPPQPGARRTAFVWIPGAAFFLAAVVLSAIVVHEAYWHSHPTETTSAGVKPAKDGPIVVKKVALDSWPPVIEIYWTFDGDWPDEAKQRKHAVASNATPCAPSVESAEEEPRAVRSPKPSPVYTAKLSAIPAPDLLELARE